ncbi:MAG: FAD-dependent oxidoreductase, partial [Armatimonadota bacterium]
KVAVVGSGPAGLACAAQLNRAGHRVTVFERDDYVGGLLTLGIPGFKLDKEVVFRRIRLMEEEGIEFCTGTNVGVNYPVSQLKSGFDAIVLTGGATQARELPVPGAPAEGLRTVQLRHLAHDVHALAVDQVPDRPFGVVGLPPAGADDLPAVLGRRDVHRSGHDGSRRRPDAQRRGHACSKCGGGCSAYHGMSLPSGTTGDGATEGPPTWWLWWSSPSTYISIVPRPFISIHSLRPAPGATRRSSTDIRRTSSSVLTILILRGPCPPPTATRTFALPSASSTAMIGAVCGSPSAVSPLVRSAPGVSAGLTSASGPSVPSSSAGPRLTTTFTTSPLG